MGLAAVAPSVRMVPRQVTTKTLTSEESPRDVDGWLEEVVVISPWARTSLWVLIFLIVATNTLLLTVFSIVYFHDRTRYSPLWVFRIYFLSYADGHFLRETATTFCIGYICLTVCFLGYALHLVYLSIKTRNFNFGARPTSVVSTRRVSTTRSSSFIAISTSYWQRLRRSIRKFQALVSVRGPYFDLRLLLDDTIELMSQTAAAYASSHTISNVGLNMCYGFVIFTTSMVPFAISRVYRHSLVKQRMACLIADVVVDFVWGTLLPMWTAVPVVELYITQGMFVDQDNTISISRQIKRVIVLSWGNYILTVIPFIATLLTLFEVQSILRQVPMTADNNSSRRPSFMVLNLRYAANRRQKNFLFRAWSGLLPLYGLIALVVTIAANGVVGRSSETSQGCIHRVYPWFTTTEACVGRRIDCSASNISGEAREIELAVDQMNRQVLTDLLIAFCPALTVPPRVTQLTHLESIAIHHSHIVGWMQEASLTPNHFPVLRALYLNSVTFQELPQGLISQPLSHVIDWVHLENISNATELLTSVGTNWNQLRFFDCMACELTEFPAAVKEMSHLSMLLLMLNDISGIPEDWNINAANLQLDALWIDGNVRIPRLPDSLWRKTASMDVLSMESTGIQSAPEWLADIIDEGLSIFAANTPLCTRTQQSPERIQSAFTCKSQYDQTRA